MAVEASLAHRLFGTEEPLEPALALRAGPLSLQLRRGKLARLCCEGRELWHGLAFVLRDPDWGTPEAVIEHQWVEQSARAFHARLEGFFPVSPPLRFALEIEGDAEGQLRFTAEATPDADLDCNRLGLCLLHPMSTAGAAVRLRHVDGRSSRSTLPTLIPPWPPFMLLRAVAHEWAPGCWAEAELLGDSFELEDQRNNGDASFKTYSRSNLMPRPYRLPAGVAVRQSALLSLRGGLPARLAPVHAPAQVIVEVGEAAGEMPRVGIEINPEDSRGGTALMQALWKLRPAHLHLALPAAGDEGRVDVAGLAALLEAAGTRLRLDLGAGVDAAGLSALAPSDVAVFPSDAAELAAARRAFPAARVGGGTPYYFAQLHRLDRLEGVDFVSFTTSPLVHGADDDEVMLGLSSLQAMVATLHARWPGTPVQVGPSTIGVRRSPLGGQPPSDGTRRLALAQRDPRCRAQFGAAWALGHVAALAGCGVEAITLMSLRGASAVLGDAGLTPAGHLLSRLGPPARRLRAASEVPERVAVLALERNGTRELLLANLEPEPASVNVAGFGPAKLARLDADGTGWREGTWSARLALPSYGVVRLSRPGGGGNTGR